MTFGKVQRYLPIVNLAVIFVLLFDFFILPTRELKEIPSHEAYERSRYKATRSYINYSVVSKSGNKYILPEQISRRMRIDTTFYIHRTFLLRAQCYIIFLSNETWYRSNIGHFNSDIIVEILSIFLVGLSIYNLVYPKRSENAGMNMFALSIFFYFGLAIIICL